jgi:hypothetical protein
MNSAIFGMLDSLKVCQFDKKIRYGVNRDGGYVIGELDGGYECYISAGIADEESFSRDFLNNHIIPKENCYGFDGSINDYPYAYTRNITFFKKNIGQLNDSNHANLYDLIHKYDNIFLKMDIEGGEYPWLMGLSDDQLRKFKQLVIEFHGITDDTWGCDHAVKVSCLEKLARTHYVIHAHGNNHSHTVDGIPTVLELTYINKKWLDTPRLNTQFFPTSLDFPNNSDVADLKLNFYPFVHLPATEIKE